MKKKILLLGAIIVLMLSFSISASAEEIFYTDLSDSVQNAKWGSGGYTNDTSYFDFVDETVHLYAETPQGATSGTQGLEIMYGTTVEGECLVFYDVMFPSGAADCKSAAQMQLFFGLKRATYSHNPYGMTAVGEWYNVMFHIDEKQENAYYRVKLASSDEWGSKTTVSIGGNTGAARFKAYYTTTADAGKTKGECQFDNIRVIQGLYLDELKFLMNDEEITSVADIQEPGELKASYKVMNYDLDFDNTDIDIDVTEITPILVVFDSNGMMLDCYIDMDKEIGIYDNDAETSLDISEIYEQMDGGTIRFYVWNSIEEQEALFNEVVVPAMVE